MIRKLALTAVLAAAFAAPAFAYHCPADMAKIDAALATATLSEEDMAKVKELRARGEEEHNAGNHDASVATLAEAMALLGL
jgi:hypothetical protein